MKHLALTTWIEASVKGRHGGPVRAGSWSAAVVGTHPITANQRVWIEVLADDEPLGLMPGFWVENRGPNNLWHVPVPSLAVNARLKYRAVASEGDGPPVYSPYREAVIRPNLPGKDESPADAIFGPEGLVGNRMMTVRVDERGATYDVFFPTVGMHSDVRPAAGDEPQSRSHFRAILGGLSVDHRIDWFCERQAWEVFQHYQGATNVLITELRWRFGPIRVVITDFAAQGADLPRNSDGAVSPGQYIKRFRIHNDGPTTLKSATFAVFVHAEVNGGLGEPLLGWQDGDRLLLASNQGHGHANPKLARNSTVEFAIVLDDRGPVTCEAAGPNEAILLRTLDLPAGSAATADLLVSGAFTGWKQDLGTYDIWLRPAAAWFRAADLDQVEQQASAAWDDFVEPLPNLRCVKSDYPVMLRRSALAAALHIDAGWGAVAAGYDLGIHAYCWPRDVVWVTGALDRLGHTDIGRRGIGWLDRVRGSDQPFSYWFQKYTIDGEAEWETPALDHSALIPWGLERHFRRTGDLDFVAAHWPMIEQAAGVCMGHSGHPALAWIDELSAVTSAGPFESRFGVFLFSNASAVAGLRSAARLARELGHTARAATWSEFAERIWSDGILRAVGPDDLGPGLVDAETGRFLEARRLSNRRHLWSDRPELMSERCAALSVGLLGPAVPFGLIPARDPIMKATAEALLEHAAVAGEPHSLVRWAPDPAHKRTKQRPREATQNRPSSLACLWMARYLIQLGRESGDAAAWTRALAILDALIGRLLPLGLGLQRGEPRLDEPSAAWYYLPGVWDLHAMLIETILDIAGLDYDVPGRTVLLDPILPPGWPQVGLEHHFPCGKIGYRLERAAQGTSHRLSVESNLKAAVTLQAAVTCPGLSALGPWQSRPPGPAPSFDPRCQRITWSQELPQGESRFEWWWG